MFVYSCHAAIFLKAHTKTCTHTWQMCEGWTDAWLFIFLLHAILKVWDSIFSFHYVYLSVFILPAGSHTMLLQCGNMYAGTSQSNTKYNNATTQLSIIITGLLTQYFACKIFQIMHYMVFTVTSNGCLKLYLNPWELVPRGHAKIGENYGNYTCMLDLNTSI